MSETRGEGPQAGQPRLRVEWVPTAGLVPYAGNAKIHTDEQVSEIAESIKEFGFSDPVGAWHDQDGRPVIVEGHGRVMAARELGMETVPVVWLDHLDDEGRRAYGLVHNQLTMGTGWDDERLRAELDALADIDLDALGLGALAMEPLEDVSGVSEDEPVEPDEAETRVRPGDVWRMGDHLLACGDSTDPETIEALFSAGGGDARGHDPHGPAVQRRVRR